MIRYLLDNDGNYWRAQVADGHVEVRHGAIGARRNGV